MKSSPFFLFYSILFGEQAKELKDHYSVIQFPRDQFDNTPINLSVEERRVC
jgi:hypothetical protein